MSIGGQVLFTYNLHKKHKPFGQPTLSGFRLDFRVTMNTATNGEDRPTGSLNPMHNAYLFGGSSKDVLGS